MEELHFDTIKRECSITRKYNQDVYIYVCKDCPTVFILSDLNEFSESVAKHCADTNHTIKRIW